MCRSSGLYSDDGAAPLGVVALEDVPEELVGEIRDETVRVRRRPA
jgi:CBS domain containing-hemolysin-like protein